jgi:hypothetical protein
MALPVITKFSKDYLELRIKGTGNTGKRDRTELLSIVNARILAYTLLAETEKLSAEVKPKLGTTVPDKRGGRPYVGNQLCPGVSPHLGCLVPMLEFAVRRLGYSPRYSRRVSSAPDRHWSCCVSAVGRQDNGAQKTTPFLERAQPWPA